MSSRIKSLDAQLCRTILTSNLWRLVLLGEASTVALRLSLSLTLSPIELKMVGESEHRGGERAIAWEGAIPDAESRCDPPQKTGPRSNSAGIAALSCLAGVH